jgi:hypothetical protein
MKIADSVWLCLYMRDNEKVQYPSRRLAPAFAVPPNDTNKLRWCGVKKVKNDHNGKIENVESSVWLSLLMDSSKTYSYTPAAPASTEFNILHEIAKFWISKHKLMC